MGYSTLLKSAVLANSYTSQLQLKGKSHVLRHTVTVYTCAPLSYHCVPRGSGSWRGCWEQPGPWLWPRCPGRAPASAPSGGRPPHHTRSSPGPRARTDNAASCHWVWQSAIRDTMTLIAVKDKLTPRRYVLNPASRLAPRLAPNVCRACK